jgi:hypothetical protein
MWQEANDSIMAFLAGSHLASHTLQLTEGSDRMLPEIFPAVLHISRFNLRTSLAREVLSNAENNLARMAIPHILALHEDFAFAVLDMMVKLKLLSRNKRKSASIKTVHAKIEDCSPHKYNRATLEQFDLVRCIRNCIIHAGGVPNKEFYTALTNMSTDAENEWQKRTDRPSSSIVSNDRIVIRHYEIIGTLAITKSLWRETNEILQKSLTSAHWKEVALEDFLRDGPITGNKRQKERALKGFIRHHYKAAKISNQDIEDALVTL